MVSLGSLLRIGGMITMVLGGHRSTRRIHHVSCYPMASKLTDITLLGAPVVTVEGVRNDFVAYISVKYWITMPTSCGVITGISVADYPACIRLPEGI